MEKWELDDEKLEKLSQKWNKKWYNYIGSRIGFLREVILDTYNLGIYDGFELGKYRGEHK